MAVIAVSLAVMSFFTTTSSPLANAAQVITSPFRTAFTAVADWFNDKQAYYADYKALEEENQELRDPKSPKWSALCVRPRPTAPKTSGCGSF